MTPSKIDPQKLDPRFSHLVQEPGLFQWSSRKIFEFYCKMVFTLWCPLKVEGRENLPQDRSYLMCSNHTSHMDSAILMCTTGRDFNDCGMLAAKDYWFDNKTRRTMANMFMNLLPIDRKPSDERDLSTTSTLDLCRQFVHQGKKSIIVYPEGTRSKTGEIQSFKKGVSIFSAQLGIPIVPVHIKGTYKAWAKGSYFMKPTNVRVVIGKPIYPQHYFSQALVSRVATYHEHHVNNGTPGHHSWSRVNHLYQANGTNGTNGVHNGTNGTPHRINGTNGTNGVHKVNGTSRNQRWKSAPRLPQLDLSKYSQDEAYDIFCQITNDLESRVKTLAEINHVK